MRCKVTKENCPHLAFCDVTGKCLEHEIIIQSEPTNQAPEAPSLEQLAKDAARYRWLREDCPWTIMCEVFNADVEAEKSYEQNKLTLDDAIDAAMKG